MPNINPAVLQQIIDLGRGEGVLGDGIDAERLSTLVLGPLFFDAVIAREPSVSDADQLVRLRALADDVVDRFLASLRP